MTGIRIVLFDDRRARDWQPFALTRPIGELRLGAWTFRERAERVLGGRCAGHITSTHLAGFEEPGAAPVLDAASAGADEPTLYLCSRAVLDAGGPLPETASDRGGVVRIGGQAAGWLAPAGGALPDAALEDCEALGGTVAAELPGTLLGHVWELVARNTEQIAADYGAHDPDGASLPDGTHAIGKPRLRLGVGVTIEPGVVFDFSEGPIWLEDGVHVRAFARLAGPIHVARRSTLFGGSYTAVSIGPHCKIRGEIEESVVLGYSNKAHDGFLGHAYLGAWVNLGAMTTNSDLKNNYGRIRMWTPAGDADTGTTKLGCLLGDHVKTGIGVLINTGTVVGAGSNIWGTELPPKYVPPFSWGTGSELGEYNVEKFLETAEIVMKRRDVQLTDGLRDVMHQAFARGRADAAG
jgi:UDP-N-acetylglucosamine diphosphorylase / glucose-1-phosphate thymidylyltransferase / UDP-N-acetylgalactosamine diphosphorylase / glucosamine-1-phosphate N-acetyltransferase / galactosamine-1-phosphate N-acetyltransferase